MNTNIEKYANPNNPENKPNPEKAYRAIALILSQRDNGVKVEYKGLKKKDTIEKVS